MLVVGVVFAQSYSSKLGMISLGGQVSNTCLLIQVQAWVREIHSDSDDHKNGGPVSLGPIPSGM